jgi:hypothetical protein
MASNRKQNLTLGSLRPASNANGSGNNSPNPSPGTTPTAGGTVSWAKLLKSNLSTTSNQAASSASSSPKAPAPAPAAVKQVNPWKRNVAPAYSPDTVPHEHQAVKHEPKAPQAAPAPHPRFDQYQDQELSPAKAYMGARCCQHMP